MSDENRASEPKDAELERRLTILEGPKAGDMLQDDLPVNDLLWLLATGVIVSVILLWWAL